MISRFKIGQHLMSPDGKLKGPIMEITYQKVTDFKGGLVKVPILHLEYGFSKHFKVREDLLYNYSSVDPDGVINEP
jgi:hypothetical protein